MIFFLFCRAKLTKNFFFMLLWAVGWEIMGERREDPS
jgi:hypothetical protein